MDERISVPETIKELMEALQFKEVNARKDNDWIRGHIRYNSTDWDYVVSSVTGAMYFNESDIAYIDVAARWIELKYVRPKPPADTIAVSSL